MLSRIRRLKSTFYNYLGLPTEPEDDEDSAEENKPEDDEDSAEENKPEDDEDSAEENAASKIGLLTNAFSAYLGIPIELEDIAKNMQKQGTRHCRICNTIGCRLATATPLPLSTSFYTWNSFDVNDGYTVRLFGTDKVLSGIGPNTPAKDIIGELEKKFGVKSPKICFGPESISGNETLGDCVSRMSNTMNFAYWDNKRGTHGGVQLYAYWGDNKVHPTYYIDKNDLEPSKDFDFTDFKGKRDCVRGGYTYERPIGWDRCALKVVDRYGDNVWLGKDGMREKSTPGEWAVSYHGTLATNVRNIAHGGYDDGRSKRQLHGNGIYSTPTLKIAEDMYSITFTYKKTDYKMVLQNRVNLAKSVIKSASETGVGAPYFVTPNDRDIRPYGVLLKKV